MKKNRLVTNDDVGQEWLSRSVGVGVLLFRKNNSENVDLLLVRKKGSKSWGLPGGYLDYNETLQQACAREIREETGIKLIHTSLKFFMIKDTPKDLQDVCVYYYMDPITFVNNDLTEVLQPLAPLHDDDIEEANWFTPTMINECVNKWDHEDNKIIMRFFMSKEYLNNFKI